MSTSMSTSMSASMSTSMSASTHTIHLQYRYRENQILQESDGAADAVKALDE